MPLDGQAYLIAQGWSGKGSGLRDGAISRPLAIPQKRTLAGLGKDRDEAFPFWDHVFSAASQSIQIKVFNDDSDPDTSHSPDSAPVNFKRTSTGILSNRRPDLGTPATSGTTTPSTDAERSLTLVATAKRQAARAGLYSRFFRGPVLCSEVQAEELVTERVASPSSITLDDLANVSVPSGEDVPGAKSEKKRRRRERMKADDTLQSDMSLSGSILCSIEEARNARKAEKKQKKHEEARRATLSSPDKPKSKEREVGAASDGSPGEADPKSVSKKKKRRKDETGEVEEGGHESAGSMPPGSADEKVLKARRKEEKEKRRAAKEARRAKEGKS